MNARLWEVMRVIKSEPVPVGLILQDESGAPSFIYLPAYTENSSSMELSCSLPLGIGAFPEARFRPYFEGLLPEGDIRAAIAERNGVREEDYLALLGVVGHDCIGDVAIFEHGFGDGRDSNVQDAVFRARFKEAKFKPVTLSDISRMLRDLTSVAETTSSSRLSLAGSQRKIGLTHVPGEPMDTGWFQPLDCAPSTHILKVGITPRYASLELLCMSAAPKLGIDTARTSGLWLSQPVVVSERFDREVVGEEDGSLQDVAEHGANAGKPPVAYRLHQEDLNQAFGQRSGSKYYEVEGGSYLAIGRLLRNRSVSAAEDLEQLARIAVYNFLVGNCDNHLKNLSILHVGSRGIKLSPAYDILNTTIFESEPGVPKYTRRMGMRLGSAFVIDDVTAADFGLLADDLGLGRRAVARICREMGDGIIDALMEAGDDLEPVSEAIPYDAEDLVEEMTPRLAVVRAVS